MLKPKSLTERIREHKCPACGAQPNQDCLRLAPDGTKIRTERGANHTKRVKLYHQSKRSRS